MAMGHGVYCDPQSTVYLMLLAGLLTGGCGRSTGGRVEVSGHVTLEGVPLEEGAINLIPLASGTSRRAATIVTPGAIRSRPPKARCRASIG